MSQPYLGQIILVGFNFAPTDYVFCDGRLMSIADNTTLFQLIGTTYGGDGVTTFALPDLRGRIPIGTGQGPGLQNYDIGQATGSETVTVLATQMPVHTHANDISALTATTKCRNGAGNRQTPVGNVLAVETAGAVLPYHNALAPNANMSPGAIAMSGSVTASNTGGSQSHQNLQPYLAMGYCIALVGDFPSR
jgi:microcystin-dependent protein